MAVFTHSTNRGAVFHVLGGFETLFDEGNLIGKKNGRPVRTRTADLVRVKDAL
jgi:hypothetical protein